MPSFAPVTPQGQEVVRLFFVLLAVSALILLIVYGALFVILRRDRERGRGRPGGAEPAQIDGNVRLEALWTAVPVLILAGTFALTVGTMRAVYPADPPPDALRVQITGRQWWWEFAYPDFGVVTANELHVPTGVPLLLEITSADVVHSFWVPPLGWKRDAVPGRTNTMSVSVTESGVYDCACTEFCGVQHAWMRIRFVAEPEGAFQSWVQAQRQPAAATPAAGSLVTRGQQVFLASTCVSCHSVSGTAAAGQVGPNLTHFGGRNTLGAGIAPNTTENLRRWVQDARAVKPGVLMPPFALSDDDLDALVAYLQSLR
jgi:cytochrome c oxidase subunit II